MTALPETFGRYRVARMLGEGAAGSVFVARDEVLGREVAIKTIKTHVLQFGGGDRFYNEMRAIAGLSHPNVVGVFDVGKQDGVPYLVMEVASGGSLRSRIQQGPLPPSEVCVLGIQIAHALSAAHARGIVHRDVKPANILQSDSDTWKLADFGVAHVPDSSATITGQFLGSPAYAAPESLHHGAFGPASDVYGLAATLFEAATGRKPHDDAGFETRMRLPGDDSDRFRAALADRVPPPIADAIVQALASSPDARPSATRFAEQLAGVARSGSQPALLASAVRPPHSRRRMIAVIALALLALSVIALASRGSEDSGIRPASTPVQPPSDQPTSIPESTDGQPTTIKIPTKPPPRKVRHKKMREREHDD